MAPQQQNNNRGLGFVGMVGAVFAALKLKEHWDARYKPVATDEESTVAGLPTPYRDDEEAVSLLDTELPGRRGIRQKPKKNCCMCCGMDCGLFCKALGIVTALFVLYGLFKFIMWAVTPAPTGLEGMPQFGAIPPCQDANFLWNGKEENTFNITVNADQPWHSSKVFGNGAGTLIVTQGLPDQNEVVYKVSLKTNKEELFNHVTLDKKLEGRFSMFMGPYMQDACLRYDVTMLVPQNLRKLVIQSDSFTHLKFDPNAKLNLESISITSKYQGNADVLVLPSQNVKAERMSLDVWRGWVVGDISAMNTTMISTQNGDAVIHVKAYASVPMDNDLPEAVIFQTISGAGRTDVTYISPREFSHRPIETTHRSGRKGDIYLNYKDAEFSGLVELPKSNYWVTGPLNKLALPEGPFTHYVNSAEGVDRMNINSQTGSVSLKL